MSNESQKLAGHASSEGSFGSCPHSQEPDGVMRLGREKTRRQIEEEWAAIFRKALSTGAQGQRGMWRYQRSQKKE